MSVDVPTGSFAASDTEDEPLITSNAPSPAVPLTASAQNSPISRQKQFLPPKSSPKMLQKISSGGPSPQQSPRITRVPPVAFFMGSDASVLHNLLV